MRMWLDDDFPPAWECRQHELRAQQDRFSELWLTFLGGGAVGMGVLGLALGIYDLAVACALAAFLALWKGARCA